MKLYRAGIDVGSTTVKLVVLDENGDLLYSDYRRHQAKTQATLLAMLAKAAEAIGNCMLSVSLTGSGAVALAKALGLPFVQEVVAVADALSRLAPEAEVAIELGGEDAKLLFLRPTLEARMNGVCAGGAPGAPAPLLTRWRLSCIRTPRASMRRRGRISKSIPLRRAAACLPKQISNR